MAAKGPRVMKGEVKGQRQESLAQLDAAADYLLT